MLNFSSSLSPDSDALVIFVNDKFRYNDKKGVLSKALGQKLKSYISALISKKLDEDITSFDISDKKKCFLIKVKNNYKSYTPQEKGGSFFSNLKQYKKINKIDIYPDSLDFENKKLIRWLLKYD